MKNDRLKISTHSLPLSEKKLVHFSSILRKHSGTAYAPLTIIGSIIPNRNICLEMEWPALNNLILRTYQNKVFFFKKSFLNFNNFSVTNKETCSNNVSDNV